MVSLGTLSKNMWMFQIYVGLRDGLDSLLIFRSKKTTNTLQTLIGL